MAEPAPDAEVTLRRITSKTIRKICELSVAEGQKKFVAPNAVSIAQAHFSKDAWLRAICAGETPVGFLLLWESQKQGKYSLGRFMIDARYQGRGYGRKALGLVIGHVRRKPRAKELILSVVRAEGGAEELYKSYGFMFTGKIDEGEHVMKLDLKKKTSASAAQQPQQ